MFKLFEWIGMLLAILLMFEFLNDPRKAFREMRNGPMPHLGKYNRSLRDHE